MMSPASRAPSRLAITAPMPESHYHTDMLCLIYPGSGSGDCRQPEALISDHNLRTVTVRATGGLLARC